MENEKTVAILICYIGKLPWYFDYFVFSCSYNPTIDFFIISNDTSFKKPLPNNITLINKSLSEISEIATKKMGFEINY